LLTAGRHDASKFCFPSPHHPSPKERQRLLRQSPPLSQLLTTLRRIPAANPTRLPTPFEQQTWPPIDDDLEPALTAIFG